MVRTKEPCCSSSSLFAVVTSRFCQNEGDKSISDPRARKELRRWLRLYFRAGTCLHEVPFEAAFIDVTSNLFVFLEEEISSLFSLCSKPACFKLVALLFPLPYQTFLPECQSSARLRLKQNEVLHTLRKL